MSHFEPNQFWKPAAPQLLWELNRSRSSCVMSALLNPQRLRSLHLLSSTSKLFHDILFKYTWPSPGPSLPWAPLLIEPMQQQQQATLTRLNQCERRSQRQQPNGKPPQDSSSCWAAPLSFHLLWQPWGHISRLIWSETTAGVTFLSSTTWNSLLHTKGPGPETFLPPLTFESRGNWKRFSLRKK